MQKLNGKYKGKKFTHVNEAFTVLAELAQQTADQRDPNDEEKPNGNYGVSSMILDEEGVIVAVAVNTTISGFFHHDKEGDVEFTMPFTDGHAEKNVIRVLDEINEGQIKKGLVPYDPQKLTLIVNLDCCAQCMEAAAKYKGVGLGQVISAAPDDGVAYGAEHYAEGTNMRTIAEKLLRRLPITTSSEDKEKIEEAKRMNDHHSSVKVQQDFVRAWAGKTPPVELFAGQSLDLDVYKACYAAFHDSKTKVRRVREVQGTVDIFESADVREMLRTGNAPSGLAAYVTQVGKLHIDSHFVPRLDINGEKDMIPEELIRIIVREAAASYVKHNFFRACAIVSPDGFFVGTKRDKGFEGAGSLSSSWERAIKTVDMLRGNGRKKMNMQSFLVR